MLRIFFSKRKKVGIWEGEPQKSLLKAVEENNPSDIHAIFEKDNQRKKPWIHLNCPVYTQNGQNDMLITLAVDMRHPECVRAIAQNRRADEEDQAGYGYAFAYALDNGMDELAKLLLAKGASTWRAYKEKRPLQIAIEKDDAAMTSLILAHDPELVKMPTKDGEDVSALKFATSHRRWKSLAVMIEFYKKNGQRDKNVFNSVLFEMARYPNCFNSRIALSMVELLAGDIHGEAMYLAVSHRNVKMIAILCSSPEDLMQKKDVCGLTASEICVLDNSEGMRARQDVHDAQEMCHHYRYSTARSLLTLFVHAKRERNKKSFFYNVPSEIIENKILPFVTTEIHEYQKTISQRERYLPRVFNWYQEQKKPLQIQSPEEMKSTPGFQERVMAYLRGSHLQTHAQSRVVRGYPPEPRQEESEEKSTASSSPPPARDRSPSPSRG